MALVDFAWRMGSSNCTSEGPGVIVDETRQDAELLMSLMLSTIPSAHADEFIPDSEPVSSSERSYSSDSSCSNSSRREVFSFTCPSLSLENPGPSASSSIFHGSFCGHRAVLSGSHGTSLPTNTPPPPALLLGRPLKVDDRDALRLSADAMSRNVLQSFQKAMDWRVQVWLEAVCKQLANQERAMLEAGAGMEEIRGLLETPEAALIMLLRKIAEEHEIAVSSVNTSFQVLPQRVEQNKDAQDPPQRRESIDSTSTTSSLGHEDQQAHQDCSTATDARPSGSLSESDYLYTVIHKLEFTSDVYVETPAGLTEITFKVPGTIQGNFSSNEVDPAAELRSVTVDLDTSVLAHMVEKGCRTVVRTSVEKVMYQAEETQESDATAETAQDAPAASSPSKEQDSMTCTMSSPVSYADRSAAIVTPRTVSQGSQARGGPPTTTSAPKTLFSIPDDFGSEKQSRRVSPSLPMKRGTPPPAATEVPEAKRRLLPLISPPGNNNNSEYHEVAEDGPSLPMLVEAACRAMNVVD